MARPALELVDTPELGDFLLGLVPYQLANGALPFLAFLLTVPGAEVAFFSAGDAIRNDRFAWKLADSLPAALRPPWWRPFNVTSVVAKDSPFGKKDLRLVGSRAPLEDTILVDDHDTAFSSQRGNLLLVSEGFGTFGRSVVAGGRAEARSKDEAVRRARADHALMRAAGIIDAALELRGATAASAASGGSGGGGTSSASPPGGAAECSLSQAVAALQAEESRSHAEEIYRRGLAVLERHCAPGWARVQLTPVTVAAAAGGTSASRSEDEGGGGASSEAEEAPAAAAAVFPWDR